MESEGWVEDISKGEKETEMWLGRHWVVCYVDAQNKIRESEILEWVKQLGDNKLIEESNNVESVDTKEGSTGTTADGLEVTLVESTRKNFSITLSAEHSKKRWLNRKKRAWKIRKRQRYTDELRI